MQNGHAAKRFKISDLPKSNVFTQKLPTDEEFPSPKSSHSAERSQLGPRLVKHAAFTYVRPDPFPRNELLSVSRAALRDLAITPEDAQSKEFAQVVSGERIATVDGEVKDDDIYPWAQCYGGYQFGSWAGQLGDGRAISCAGKTPYSRFADGRAVLRSSIREYVVSEALNALGIPTTRALCLTLAPESKVRRERMEPGAVVARFAQTWLRFGTFDLARSRGDRDLVRKLANYAAEEIFGGWENLPAKTASDEGTIASTSIVA
ncbi:hypothetical protein AMS68_008011 [Peltaster fructicola]|uniref:Selenoprotein O n=1 Tax=Peltaster fructicola TaxID=286661 RepID=A0A6H0Y638_9PEZI|nr:hypothetical protein AMS68_008011 [Peltaster fructicola]